MNIDANKVIHKLMEQIKELVYQMVLKDIQIEELTIQLDQERAKKKALKKPDLHPVECDSPEVSE